MPYTLTIGLAWVLLGVLVGVVVGWLLRSIVAGRQLARARARHEADLAAATATPIGDRSPDTPGDASGDPPDDVAGPGDPQRPDPDDRPSAAVDDDPPPDGELAAAVDEVHVATGGDDDATRSIAALAAKEPAPPVVDLDEGARVLGRPLALDDLTVVEGIGPEIAELCRGIGIVTWGDLAATETSLLRTMLADAGPRFGGHDPSTWPHRARLLAEGRWDEVRRLHDELDRGRPTP